MFRIIHIILIGLITQLSIGQYVRIERSLELDIQHAVLNPHTDSYHLFTKDSLLSYNLSDLKEIGRTRLKLPEEYVINKSRPVVKDSTVYFVSRNGGMVYRLVNDSLVRLDNSFEHKMQINSTVFVHQDTIMRYGGYGFWSTRNFFTYFEDRAAEWEIIPPTGSNQLPVGVMDAQVLTSGDQIFVLGGLRLQEFNPLKVATYGKAWVFDVKRKAWSLLGDLTIDFQKLRHVGTFDGKLLFSGNGTKYLAKVRENLLYEVEFNPLIRYSYKDLPVLFNESKFYVLHNASKGFILEAFEEEDFFQTVGKGVPLYSEDTFPWEPVALGAGVLALLFIGYRVKSVYLKKNRVLVGEEEVRYKNQILDLDSKSRLILLTLLRSPDPVSTNEILSIVENKEHNQAHNVKVKNQYIETVNFKLKALLALQEDPITSSRSATDKRMKVYRIKKQYFLLQ